MSHLFRVSFSPPPQWPAHVGISFLGCRLFPDARPGIFSPMVIGLSIFLSSLIARPCDKSHTSDVTLRMYIVMKGMRSIFFVLRTFCNYGFLRGFDALVDEHPLITCVLSGVAVPFLTCIFREFSVSEGKRRVGLIYVLRPYISDSPYSTTRKYISILTNLDMLIEEGPSRLPKTRISRPNAGSNTAKHRSSIPSWYEYYH